MAYNTTLYISDAGTLTCLDYERGYCVLWEIPLTKSDEAKVDELISRKMDFILRDKEVVEEYLKGNISMEDIEKWQTASKDHTLYDGLFAGCSKDVQNVWEQILQTNAFFGNSIGKNYFLTELDKYMLMNASDFSKVKDGSLEDIITFVNHLTDSWKTSLELYSLSIQTLKSEELDVWERFRNELAQLK